MIIPLHKGGDKEHPENYIPASFISNLNKIFENSLKKLITDFLDKNINIQNKNIYNKIIADEQFIFRYELSTQYAIENLTNIIYKYFSNSNPLLAVFIVLEKVFDTIIQANLFKNNTAYV